MNKKHYFIIGIMITLIISISSYFLFLPNISNQSLSTISDLETELNLKYSLTKDNLTFQPECDYYGTPEEILTGWNESVDYRNVQRYCLFRSDIIYIHNDISYNEFNQPYALRTSNLYYILNPSLTEQGNVRDVKIEFDYFYPSFEEYCLPNELYSSTKGDVLKNNQWLLLANHNNGFLEDFEFDFNSAISTLEGKVVCDEWQHFSVPVKDFINEYGSSFSGQSKSIGTFGFQFSNVYIYNITVTGTSQTMRIF